MHHHVAREWVDAHARSVEESRARRDRVLQHPDLVKRLMEMPAGIREPHKWNGWIPPRTMPEVACGGGCGHGRPCRVQHFAPANDSPIRKQLVEIAAEALRREQLDLYGTE